MLCWPYNAKVVLSVLNPIKFESTAPLFSLPFTFYYPVILKENAARCYGQKEKSYCTSPGFTSIQDGLT